MLFLCFQAKVGTVLTLVVDIFIPFATISILNSILIRTIRQRSRDLDSFGEGSRVSSVPTQGECDSIERNKQKQKLAKLMHSCFSYFVLHYVN